METSVVPFKNKKQLQHKLLGNIIMKDSIFTIAVLEQQIFDLEGIRVVFRISDKVKLIGVQYADKYTNRFNQTVSVNAFRARINKALADMAFESGKPWCGIQYDIISGNGLKPHGSTKVKTVRDSYHATEE